MSKLTIREIAKMAGVSPTAVSFVINNKEGVSEETRRNVNAVIERTNFRPSLNSRRLYFKKSFNISIVIRNTSSPFNDLFYFEIAKGLLQKSKEFGYNIVFTDISVNGSEVVLPEIIKQNDTDGIIFLQDTEKAILNEVNRHNIPYVIIDSHISSNDYTCINADYELSSYVATKYLMDKGHRDIGFIGSSYIPDFYLQAFTGFRNALAEADLPLQPAWMSEDASDENSAYKCMEKILSNKSVPTAIFSPADIFSIGAIRCARDNGYRIPQDISFISIDDILLSRYCEPKLTTIRIDKEEMGCLAMEAIVKKIDGETVAGIIVKSDNLIIRDSVYTLASKGN